VKEYLRLDKILAHMGIGTRTEIRKMMKKGLVSVNGEIIKDPAHKINPEESSIMVAGEPVIYKRFIYLMLNKPGGYLSATTDEYDKTVLDLLTPEHQIFAPFPVGRLDKDTEGLLLLTNDGKLGHHLTSPRRHIPKIYYALIRGTVDAEDQRAFAEGVVLDDGYQTLPAQLTILKAGVRSEIELTIYEGKYHQVKRMFEVRGKEVIYLKRIKMGPLALDESLAPGEYRELTPEELAQLQEDIPQ
jgi:16S rRNA pseudouridine516 synthase